MASWIIEKLDTSKHSRDNFDCGQNILNIYLKTRANQEQKKWLNVTYVMRLHLSHEILGYYTLSNSAIKLAAMLPNLKKDIPHTYDIPTIKIGRLAVDQNHHNKGFGSLLLRNALNRIIEISTLSGIRGVEVIAKDLHAVNFYQKFGFVSLVDTHNLLFLPIATVIKATKNEFELSENS